MTRGGLEDWAGLAVNEARQEEKCSAQLRSKLHCSDAKHCSVDTGWVHGTAEAQQAGDMAG